MTKHPSLILMESGSADLNQRYSQVREQALGPLTQEYGVNWDIRHLNIQRSYKLNPFQIGILQGLFVAFASIESQIEPEKLVFEHGWTDDDDLLLYRILPDGVKNLTIGESDLLILSTLRQNTRTEPEYFEGSTDELDYETIAYKFFC